MDWLTDPGTLFAALSALLLLGYIYNWRRGGFWGGRQYGNMLAEYLLMPRNLFHAMLDNGLDGPSLLVLNSMRKAKMPPQMACVELAPLLIRGMIALEERFGPQPQIEAVKPTIHALYAKWESDFKSST
ncbi:MAG: hypothetical protein LPJ91_05195 [Pseudazoarcus pumilus]|nr:hypothetical protein [Pseudazoarcus pumilus]